MLGRSRSASVFVITLLCALTAPALATAQEAPAEAAPEAPRASDYAYRVQEGVAAILAGNRDAATAKFREAEALDGTRAEAAYYLAVLERMAGNHEPAIAGFTASAQNADDSAQPRWRARALQAVAETYERMDGRGEDARSAWQVYVRFADMNPTVSHPQMGRARIAALDLMGEQERVFVDVRARIAERERVAAEGERESAPRGRRRR